MRENKNGLREGDFVEYVFRELNDELNGAQGEVLELIDDPSEYFTLMARVRWTDGTSEIVPAGNLYPLDNAKFKAA